MTSSELRSRASFTQRARSPRPPQQTGAHVLAEGQIANLSAIMQPEELTIYNTAKPFYAEWFLAG